jgi:hypothetical protein
MVERQYFPGSICCSWMWPNKQSIDRFVLHNSGTCFLCLSVGCCGCYYSRRGCCCCFCDRDRERLCELRPLTSPLSIPQMIYQWMWSNGAVLTGKCVRTRRKTCPSATSSTTNPTWSDVGQNPSSDHVSCGTAILCSHVTLLCRLDFMLCFLWAVCLYLLV